MRIKMLTAVCALACAAATASATTVTATVSDTEGQVWSIGSYTATLTLPSEVFRTTIPTVNGVAVPVIIRGTIDLKGVLRGTFTDTSTVDQKGAVWVFKVCPHTSGSDVCQTVRTPITGASQDLTSLFINLPAPRFVAVGYAYGYRDEEVQRPILDGALYWNVLDSCLHQWNGTKWSGCHRTLLTETTPPPIAQSTTISGESVASALSLSDSDNSAVAEATTAATDIFQAGTSSNRRTGSSLTANTNSHVIDYRTSSTLDYCRNQNSVNCHNFTATWDTPAFEPNGTVFMPPRHLNVNLLSTDVSPGVYDTGVWNTTQGASIGHFSASEGISQTLVITHNQNGIGDGVGLYLYHNYSGCGSPMGDDEGCFAASFASLENSSQEAASTGTIATVAGDNQSIVFTGSTNLGQGRPAVRLRNASGADQAVLIDTVTSIDGSSPTSGIIDADHLRIGVTHAMNQAQAIGQCSDSPCHIDVPSNPAVPQKMTFSMKITGGSAAGFQTGDACITGGGHFEKIKIVEVSGNAGVGNIQKITAMMWQPEAPDLSNAPPILVQDTYHCGLWGTLDASIVTGDPNYPIRQFFPIMGALDPHTLIYAFPGKFRQQYLSQQQVYDIWPQTDSVSITSDGSYATVTTSKSSDWNGRSVTISGTTSFNGTFTFAARTSLNSGQASVYVFPSNLTVTSAETGTASTNTGRTGIRLYTGDLVASPYNPDQSNEVLENYAGFFNSTTKWAPGDIVEFPPYWYTLAGMQYTHQMCYSDNCSGYVWQYAGAGVNGSYKGLDFGNSTSPKEYIGFGGHLSLPTALSIGGPHNPLIDFSYLYNGGPSLIAGGTALKFACPLDNGSSNCQAPYDSWALFRAPTQSKTLSFFINVPNNSFDLDFLTGRTFSFAPTGFTSGGLPIYLDTSEDKSWIELGASIRGNYSSGLHFKGTSGKDAWFQEYPWNSNAIITLGDMQQGDTNHPTPITTDSSELHVSHFYADSSAHLVDLKVGYPETPSYGTIKTTLIGATGVSGIVTGYLWVPIMPDGTAGSSGRTDDIQFVSVPEGGLSSAAYVQITCPTAIAPWHPAGTTYEVWGYGNAGVYWRVGACPIGGTINDTRGSASPSGPLPEGANGKFATGDATIAGQLQFITRDANGFDVTDTYLKRTSAGVLSLGTTPGGTDGILNAAAITGPDRAPTGKCTDGEWSLSKDGIESFCRASTWVSRSSWDSGSNSSSPVAIADQTARPLVTAPVQPLEVHIYAPVSSAPIPSGSCTTWISVPIPSLSGSMTIALSFASPIPPGWLTGQPAFSSGTVTMTLCNFTGAAQAFPTTMANIAAR